MSWNGECATWPMRLFFPPRVRTFAGCAGWASKIEGRHPPKGLTLRYYHSVARAHPGRFPHGQPRRNRRAAGQRPRRRIGRALHPDRSRPAAVGEALPRLLDVLAARKLVNTEEKRRGVDDLGKDIYDKLTYYEKWILSACQVLLGKGLITSAEAGGQDGGGAKSGGRSMAAKFAARQRVAHPEAITRRDTSARPTTAGARPAPSDACCLPS